ncbi:54S ribosomal protein [Salix suchowensis]|nr:54S ribosomal protein [Salix suchowensis]
MRSLHLISRIHKTLNLKTNPNFTLTSSNFTRRFTSPSQESTPSPREPPPSTDRVTSIVDELSKLTLLEVSDLTEVLRTKLEIKEMHMGPGMKGGAVGGAAAAKAEEKVEKTVFDVKLEGFDAASKIKVIKEVRGFTDLGLKEAKDLVEKAPTLLKKGVTKDEAEKIVEKMKGVGAKVTME